MWWLVYFQTSLRIASIKQRPNQKEDRLKNTVLTAKRSKKATSAGRATTTMKLTRCRLPFPPSPPLPLLLLLTVALCCCCLFQPSSLQVVAAAEAAAGEAPPLAPAEKAQTTTTAAASSSPSPPPPTEATTAKAEAEEGVATPGADCARATSGPKELKVGGWREGGPSNFFKNVKSSDFYTRTKNSSFSKRIMICCCCCSPGGPRLRLRRPGVGVHPCPRHSGPFFFASIHSLRYRTFLAAGWIALLFKKIFLEN
jgi:hypothetical protein